MYLILRWIALKSTKNCPRCFCVELEGGILEGGMLARDPPDTAVEDGSTSRTCGVSGGVEFESEYLD
jgi:hypothetical protein